MRRRLFNWQGQRFVYLGLEGEPGRPLAQQSTDLFARAGAELAALDLSLLRNTVRTRIFARTSAARAAGSEARAEALVSDRARPDRATSRCRISIRRPMSASTCSPWRHRPATRPAM
jgi:hypothetical protein